MPSYVYSRLPATTPVAASDYILILPRRIVKGFVAPLEYVDAGIDLLDGGSGEGEGLEKRGVRPPNPPSALYVPAVARP